MACTSAPGGSPTAAGCTAGACWLGRAATRCSTASSRRAHPKLFAELATGTGARPTCRGARKLLYPYIYGGRKRRAFKPKLKELLDRVGFWTLRR